MQVARDPNGKLQVPLQVMRCTPGGPDAGQSDRSQSGKVALSNAGATTVWTYTVTVGKTLFFGDVSFDVASSTCDVSIQVGGIPIWQRFLQTALGITEVGRTWPLSAPAGSTITVVFGATAAGTPNGYFNFSAWEQ